MLLVVAAIRAEALDVVSVELRHPQGKLLPAFSPGAHLEMTLPAGAENGVELIRHYSLCGSSSDESRYVIAVSRAENGRGGSRSVHERVRVGSLLSVRGPRNQFPLEASALHYHFIAGGIGITPILSMIDWCERQGKDWSLLYCARSRLRAAFYEVLKHYGTRVSFHFDDEARGLPDLANALKPVANDEHVYCCGPGPLMSAVEVAGAQRPPGTVHFEWFGGKGDSLPQTTGDAFDVVVRSTGSRFRVEAGKSILEVLEENGVAVPFSCREGLCRTCETGLCEGLADHRDFVLSNDERNAQRSIVVCVSRSFSPLLVLDI
ncbi:PDR/VanB family oxidoreductase [Paraburkholderia sp. GAS32]|uniref:PDR/VanB family oxidoreductase n=1 Tax=Paraburkholderia sp. GAS32 TaxID=3035129 RepID=UPI003D20310F